MDQIAGWPDALDFGVAGAAMEGEDRSGDLAVFALDEIEMRQEVRSYDVPHGTWRFTRPPAGMRATIVGGTPTWLDGASTGVRPGAALNFTGG